MREARVGSKVEKKEDKKSIDLGLIKDPAIKRGIVIKMSENTGVRKIEITNSGIEKEMIHVIEEIETEIDKEIEIEKEEVEVGTEEIVIVTDINMKKSKKILISTNEDKFKELELQIH